MDNYKVYADLTFLVNFVMDFLVLWTTAKTSRIIFSYYRIVLASLLGGVYAVGYLFQEIDEFYSLPVKLMFSCFLLFVAFWPQNWQEFKKTILYFYSISFATAGAIMAIVYLFYDSIAGLSFSYIYLFGVAFLLLLGFYGANYLNKQIFSSILHYHVEIQFDDLICNGEGFLDTGNGLRDPLTKKPVLVAEYELLKKYIPDDFNKIIENTSGENEMLEALANSSWANRLRIIPFSSVGKRNGLLIGIRSDNVCIKCGNKSILHNNLVIAIYKEKLSSNGNYQMLIPAEILQ